MRYRTLDFVYCSAKYSHAYFSSLRCRDCSLTQIRVSHMVTQPFLSFCHGARIVWNGSEDPRLAFPVCCGNDVCYDHICYLQASFHASCSQRSRTIHNLRICHKRVSSSSAYNLLTLWQITSEERYAKLWCTKLDDEA